MGFCGHSCIYVGLKKSSGLDSGKRGLLWFCQLSALFDDGYNLLITCGNILVLIKLLITDVYLIDDDALIFLTDICNNQI